jgi:hypothetical protein
MHSSTEEGGWVQPTTTKTQGMLNDVANLNRASPGTG